MKIRILGLGLAWTFCLGAQRHFSWENSCFNNPALPYCQGRDYAVKRPRPGKNSSTGAGTATSPLELEQTVDAAGIDWRFADPAADALAVLNCAKLSDSALAHSLIDQSGASQGLRPADVQNIFRALSGVKQVALSIREGRIVLLVTGRAPDSILPAPEAGWKATSLAGNAILIGDADAVDQVRRRLLLASSLSELAEMAFERPVDSDFWSAGSAKLAGPEAVTAGVARFSFAASMRDRLTSDTVFEFNQAPDPAAIGPWLSTLADAKIDGAVVHVSMSMATEETRQNFGKIAVSPLGQRLGVLIKSAQYLPVRDTETTVHTRPVIFGLADGPKELK